MRSFKTGVALALVCMLAVGGCGGSKAGQPVGRASLSEGPDASAEATFGEESLTSSPTVGLSGTATRAGGTATKGPVMPPGLPTSQLAAGDCAKLARTASDRGVTKDTIKIAFFIPKSDTAVGVGVGLSDSSHKKAIKPYIDQINASGGICGRKVEYVTYSFNGLDDSDKRSVCLKATQEAKVFATIDSLGFFGGGHACLMENKTPYVTMTGYAEDYIKQNSPWMWSMRINRTRMIRNFSRFIKARGIANPSTKIGLLSDDSEGNRKEAALLKKRLTEEGLKVAAEFVASADFTTGPTQMSDAALQFKIANVGLVLPLISFIHLTSFMNNAKAQAYKPAYAVTFDLTLDFTTSTYPEDQFDGTQGMTDTITGQDKAKIPPIWGQQYCIDIYNKRVGDNDATALALGLVYCQAIELFGEALKRAGANPTRQGWTEAMGTIDSFDRVAVTGPLSFSSTKHDGGAYLASVQWHAQWEGKSCKCFVMTDRPKPAEF